MVKNRSALIGAIPLSRRVAIGGLVAGAVLGSQARATPRYRIEPDIVVAKDGSGQFTSVHVALQSIPRANRERMIVLVRDGTYEEAVRVDAAYVTVRGESRRGTRIALNRPASAGRDAIGSGVFNSSSTAHDLVIETITIHNTVEQAGPHAFALSGRSDRVIVQDADVLSRGADTLALWRTFKTPEEAGLSEGPGATPLTEDGGRYYHRDLCITGSVDFICPRGWCYMTDSQIEQVYDKAEAAFWHDGGNLPDKKFVIRNTLADGPPNFFLGRAHRDAQFYFLGCTFTERMRDSAPYLVSYPLDGGVPSEADIARNAKIASETKIGVRNYFHNTHRKGGDFAWMKDNLDQAPGAPRSEDITPKWTFAGTWDPEDTQGPRVVVVRTEEDRFELEFDRLVTVKGAPDLALRTGGTSRYLRGSGSNTLVFARSGSAAPSHLLFERGAIIASEAYAALVFADPKLPA